MAEMIWAEIVVTAPPRLLAWTQDPSMSVAATNAPENSIDRADSACQPCSLTFLEPNFKSGVANSDWPNLEHLPVYYLQRRLGN